MKSSGSDLSQFIAFQEGRGNSILRDVFIAHVPVREMFLPKFCS
jgi:hypothetical protein